MHMEIEISEVKSMYQHFFRLTDHKGADELLHCMN